MRKPDESSLRKALVTDEYSNKFDLTLGQNNYSCEMDGGALLHKVSWVNGSNLKKIAKSYVQYVRKHYGKSYIVSDEYESASTKSVEQNRRGKTFPEMSRCQREERHNCPAHSRKIYFQHEQQSSIDQDTVRVL